MAGSANDYLENKLLDHIVGKASYTMPTAYVALSTTTPADNGTNVTEPAAGAYARVATAGSDWNSASGGSISNANAITFPVSTAAWGTITHFVIYDAATNGNALLWGSLGSSQIVGTGYTLTFSAGNLVITLD